MDLRQHSHVSPLEALDEPHFPERAAALELVAGEFPDQRGQLAGATGRRHGDAPEVAVEIELGIIDPVGPVETEGNSHQALAQRWQVLELARHQPLPVLEAEAARCGGGIEDQQREHVEVAGRTLGVDHVGVDAAELTNYRLPSLRSGSSIGANGFSRTSFRSSGRGVHAPHECVPEAIGKPVMRRHENA